MRLFDYQKASRLMREREVDVLLAHTKPNVEYLTDFEWMRGWDKNNFMNEDGSAFVVSFVGLPQDEAKSPFYVAPSVQTGYPEINEMWIKEVHYWGPVFHVHGLDKQMDAAESPIPTVARILREKGLERGNVGVEWRQIEMIYADQLRGQLPHVKLVDGESILSELRMIKSDEEIGRLRRAAQITGEVMASVYQNAWQGMTEWDVEHHLDIQFAQRRSRHIWSEIAFGPKGAHFVGPTDTRLERGDMLRVDIGGWWGGYVADMSRSLAWGGPPSDAARKAHEAILRINRALIAAIRPGAVPSELHKLCMRMFDEQGYRSLTPQAGHSLGRTTHEPPFLVDGCDRPLEPGMIVVVEPTIRVQGVGSVNIEDMTLVSEDGCDVLTTTPREIDAYL